MTRWQAMAWQAMACATLLAAGASALPAQAQSVAEFYRGKTVNILIGVGVGGEYDLQARLVARHIGKHIPGNPLVVPQNMTGAGGIKMANYLYTQAARDGTNIGMLGNNFPATQAVGGQGVQFDSVKFLWLGIMAAVVETMAVWHTAGVKTIDDLRSKQIIAGASGRGAITYIYPSMMNEYLGTKFKLVTGYREATRSTSLWSAARCRRATTPGRAGRRPSRSGFSDKLITIVAQAGPRVSDLDAPSVEELAKTPDERKLIELVTSGTHLGRPMATTPDVPADRLAACVRPIAPPWRTRNSWPMPPRLASRSRLSMARRCRRSSSGS